MIENIRNKIVAGLYAYINKPVIFQPQNTPLPDYPFVAFSITSDYMRTLDDGNLQNVPQLVDLKETLSSNVEITFSFNAYSLNSLEAKNLGKLAHDYFRFAGYQYLSDNGIIVVDVGNIQNRDLLEVDEYERREGFDVIIRTLDTIERTTPEIVTYTIGAGLFGTFEYIGNTLEFDLYTGYADDNMINGGTIGGAYQPDNDPNFPI